MRGFLVLSAVTAVGAEISEMIDVLHDWPCRQIAHWILDEPILGLQVVDHLPCRPHVVVRKYQIPMWLYILVNVHLLEVSFYMGSLLGLV